jgi:hypothetical protein
MQTPENDLYWKQQFDGIWRLWHVNRSGPRNKLVAVIRRGSGRDKWILNGGSYDDVFDDLETAKAMAVWNFRTSQPSNTYTELALKRKRTMSLKPRTMSFTPTIVNPITEHPPKTERQILLELEGRMTRIESRLVQVMYHLGLDPMERKYDSPREKP